MSQSSSLTSARVGSRWRLLVAAVLLVAVGATGGRALAQSEAEPLPVVAFVASADNFPDALAAGAVAGTLGAPVLLTSPAALGEAAAEALVAVAPELVVLAGGPAALSPQVETDVVALGFEARRVAGDDRTRTAEALAAFAAELGAGRPVVTGRPVTDATIPGLDADRVDGLDAAQLAGQQGAEGPEGPAGRDGQDGSDGDDGSDGVDATALWALVNSDGSLISGSGVIATRDVSNGTGAYQVTFDRDVTACATAATPRPQGRMAEITIAAGPEAPPMDGSGDEGDVATLDIVTFVEGNGDAASFSLAVFC